MKNTKIQKVGKKRKIYKVTSTSIGMTFVICPVCQEVKRAYYKGFHCCGKRHRVSEHLKFKPLAKVTTKNEQVEPATTDASNPAVHSETETDSLVLEIPKKPEPLTENPTPVNEININPTVSEKKFQCGRCKYEFDVLEGDKLCPSCKAVLR